MKALIAFVVMAVIVLTLIEVNERIKAKRPKPEVENRQQEEDCNEACADCGLSDVCEKEKKEH